MFRVVFFRKRRHVTDTRRMRRLLAAVLLWGCYAPHPQAGAPCANGACPSGLVCSPATQTCEVTATSPPDASRDAPPRDAPQIDAPPDAPPPTYAYSRRIAIHNGASSALPAGFPVTVRLDPTLSQLLAQGKVRSDYADLRVLGAGALGERDRIIDPPSGPAPAAVTFALAAPIAAGATSTDYTLVYGDPGATAAPASGSAVFPLYDDFASGIGSNWLTNGNPVTAAGVLVLHAGGSDAIATNGATDNVPILSSIELVARVIDPTSVAGASGYYYWFGYQRSNDFTATDPWVLWIARDSGSIRTEQSSPVGCENECDGTTRAQDTAWHAYTIVRNADQTLFYRDGALEDTTAVQNTEDYAVMVRNYLATSALHVDWIRARPHVSPDPTATLGAEIAN